MRFARFPTAPLHRRAHRRLGHLRDRWAVLPVVGVSMIVLAMAATAFAPSASAAGTKVQLGTATPFAVLAGTEVTDVPTSSITGDVGLSPASGSFYAGLTQAEVTGTIYSTDATGPAGAVNNPALLTSAKNDLTTAFVSAAGQSPTSTFTAGDNQLGGKTLTAGVYAFGHAATANITAASPLILNGEGNANSVFVFQASSDLVTASNSVVELENGAQACNVFWQIGSSATLSSASTFVGTLMALTSATLDTGATVQGRILARNGAVTLDANTITIPPTCAITPAVSTATTAPGAATPTTTPRALATGAAAGGAGGAAAGSTTGGAGSTTSGSSPVVPTGFPHTGLGGSAHTRYGVPIAVGTLALVGSAGAFGVAYRRRRALPVTGDGGPARPA